ncbi:hypothetical protein [Mycobacterium sp. C31M]
MLEDARPAVEVLSEYARACRQLGHSGPDPTALQAAYSTEAEMDLAALAADGRAVAELAAAADEALQWQDGACRAVDAAWQGAGGAVATESLRGHAGSCAQTVDGLHCTAAALADLADGLQQLVAAKVTATLEIEARGARGEWLTAARTVTTGAGDQSGASELVDLRVAPFVAGDIGADWMSSMRATEDAVRQAYGAAAGAAAPPPPVFDYAGPAVPPTPVAMQPDPVVPAPAPAPAPMPAGGFGGMPSAGSGLSGLGQPVADLLGGLFDSAGTGSGSAAEDLDLDDPFPAEEEEPDDSEEVDDSEEQGDESEEEELDDPDADESEDQEQPPPEELTPAPTPVPEPVAEAAPEAEPMAVPVTEPEPPATPCEIAADALPQAGA